MSDLFYRWMLAIHVFGIVLWTASMFASLRLLSAHGTAGTAAPEALTLTERRTAVLMDIGATIALLTGLHLLFASPTKPLTQGGWMHAKLTLVVLGVFGLHGFVRARVKKIRKGDVRALPGFAMPLFVAVVLGVIVLVEVRPF